MDQKTAQSMLLQWQRKHFTQANESPFASEKWRQRLQDLETQQQILDGTFEYDDDLPMEAKELLEEMKCVDTV